MTGPRIIGKAAPDPSHLVALASAKPTGIRRTNTGGWAAIRDGRLVASYVGLGAKREAIRDAGTNEVIS